MGEYSMDQYTVSLLHFNGGITDESGKVWTAVNGAATSTAQSKFGSSSLYLTGGQHLTTPATTELNFGNEDFTIDWWEYRGNDDLSCSVFASNTKGAYQPFLIGANLGGTSIGVYMSSNGLEWDITGNPSTGGTSRTMGPMIRNAWTHYAVCRKGSTFYLFQNGKLNTTFTSTLALPNAINPGIGRYNYDCYFNGYLDEFRISKGIARWTSDFTPGESPSTPAPMKLTATAGDKKVALTWTAVTGATGYNVKRSTTAGGPYTTIASNVTGTSYEDTNVVNGTTYYYVVTAIGANGESANSNEALATPTASGTGGGQKIVRVTMTDSSEREYQLSTSEIDGFVAWYVRNVGTGTSGYMLPKQVGSVKSKEYLAFDKIISFDVIDLQG